ncbi:MAG: DNA polymerase-3 subunit delta' [Urechidicola sp.]|mgnify:FL=1|jgi:DNA polymerase-3 subunit delta'|tara:strand:+ start:2708 stop:3826 length:1119 start_codon:yes stop_codon:yes gene_type:complete
MLFKEVIGQESIKENLIQTVVNERISHAQMFQGKLGSGSFSLALAYAQFVFCSNKEENDSCGACPSCLKINTLTHPDLHFSFPVQILGNLKKSDDFISEFREMMISNPYSTEQDWYGKNENENKKGIIGVDESKELFRKLSLKSYEGGYKVAIIWLAENMNIASANKLLKLIEEPPEKTLLFLVVEDLEKILATIISRTQIIRLKSLSEVQISNQLANHHGVDEAKAIEISTYVNGDFAMALHEVSSQDNSQVFFDLFVSWMRLCFKKDVVGAVAFSANIQKLGKEKQKAFLLFVLNLFQKSLLGNFSGMENVKITPSHKEFIEKFMPYVHERNMEALHTDMSQAYYHIDRNANAKILFLDLSFILFKLIKK